MLLIEREGGRVVFKWVESTYSSMYYKIHHKDVSKQILFVYQKQYLVLDSRECNKDKFVAKMQNFVSCHWFFLFSPSPLVSRLSYQPSELFNSYN